MKATKKQLSERMTKTGTEQRIRTPAIWTILKDYAVEVKQIEEKNERMSEYIEEYHDEDFVMWCREHDALKEGG